MYLYIGLEENQLLNSTQMKILIFFLMIYKSLVILFYWRSICFVSNRNITFLNIFDILTRYFLSV